MKGAIQADHIPVNKYELTVVGLPVQLTPTAISGLEDKLTRVTLPDRTAATGGVRDPGTFTVSIPSHHTEQIAAMEVWFQEGKDPVLPTYKKVATLIMSSVSGGKDRSFTIFGCWCMGRTTPDLEMENEGEAAIEEWELSFDDMLAI